MAVYRKLVAANILPREYGEIHLLATWRDGLKNLSVVHLEILAGQKTQLHKHNYEEIMVVFQGNPVIEVEGVKFSLELMDCLAVLRGEAHRIINPTNDTCKLIIALSPHRDPNDVLYIGD
jgi:quercetin dioxygenase-like cupin family protein